ncbi:MAG TPA: hypothetical protein VML19_10695 [Verrucomicrobiae bacterium]|nr:hypothetical protein [Verrucomicrobiae bacterium]
MTLNADLEFVLQQSWTGGWTVTIVPRQPKEGCDEFASVVTGPYRAHRPLDIDMSYGWTAEEEVGYSPREFSFVTNCADYHQEDDRLYIVLWPSSAPDRYEDALAKLGTSPLGKGWLWITDSSVSHSGDTAENQLGVIERMKFEAEIKLPTR